MDEFEVKEISIENFNISAYIVGFARLEGEPVVLVMISDPVSRLTFGAIERVIYDISMGNKYDIYFDDWDHHYKQWRRYRRIFYMEAEILEQDQIGLSDTEKFLRDLATKIESAVVEAIY